MSNLLLSVMGAFAEFERSLLKSAKWKELQLLRSAVSTKDAKKL